MTSVSFGGLIDRDCPSCHERATRVLLSGQYYTLAPADVMDVVECRRCSLMYTDPIPSPAWVAGFLNPTLNPLWKDGVWMHVAWQEANNREKFGDGIGILQRLAVRGRLLDVGTGPGLFVRMAGEAGFDAIGFDVLAQAAPDVPMLPVDTLSGLPGDEYDAVTLWCVVAHVPDFMGLLKECTRLLRRGGVLLVETPNMTLWRRLAALRALLERAGLRHPSHDMLGAYNHINHFTVGTLRQAMAAAGLSDARSHLVRNYAAARTIVDDAKRALFALSRGHVNLSFPLAMTAVKPR